MAKATKQAKKADGPDEGKSVIGDGQNAGEFKAQQDQRRIRIVIPSTQDQNELKRVSVIGNGIPYSILRDVPVDVPEIVVNILNDAIETRYKRIGDVMVPYRAKSYPFERVGFADELGPLEEAQARAVAQLEALPQ
jgi:hypothetical protein